MENILKQTDEKTNYILDQDTIYGNLLQDYLESVVQDFERYFGTKKVSAENIKFILKIYKS